MSSTVGFKEKREMSLVQGGVCAEGRVQCEGDGLDQQGPS